MSTAAKIVAGVALVISIIVVGTILSLALGWFSGEANLRSFNHVKQTYQEAFDDTAAMDANARQACRIREAVDGSDPASKAQRETQLLAIGNNYDRIKGEYEAYMRDHFRGGVIRPRSLPVPYPTLDERMTEVCA